MTTSIPVLDADEAVADIPAGATLLVGGFGEVGVPRGLLAALARRRVGNLTLVANNCGSADDGVAELFKHRLVSRAIVSFPLQRGNDHFLAAYNEGAVDLQIVPQGTLAARLGAAADGLGGIYTPAGVGTELAEGREVRAIDGREYLFELPLRGDVAFVRAHIADEAGNLRYRRAARNFNPVMARAAKVSIAEVEAIVPVGAIDPDDVHSAGIYADRIVLSQPQRTGATNGDA